MLLNPLPPPLLGLRLLQTYLNTVFEIKEESTLVWPVSSSDDRGESRQAENAGGLASLDRRWSRPRLASRSQGRLSFISWGQNLSLMLSRQTAITEKTIPRFHGFSY